MLLFLAFTAFAYTRIFCFRIKNSRSPLGKQVVNVTERTNASTKARLLKELKIAKSCFLIVVVSPVCSLPSLILTGVLNLETNFLVDTLNKWSYLFNSFNATANSLIFFWRNKALRTEGMNRIKIIRDSLRRFAQISDRTFTKQILYTNQSIQSAGRREKISNLMSCMSFNWSQIF
jgi:hypothetical protein